MDISKVWEYLNENSLEQSFAELNPQQVADLKALGVPEFDEELPRGEGFVYAGSSVFQWLQDPMILHL